MTRDDRTEDPPITDDVLDRYVAQECAPAEVDAVMRWVAADPEPPARARRLERLRAIWHATRQPAGGAADGWDVDAAWRGAVTRMRARPWAALSLHAAPEAGWPAAVRRWGGGLRAAGIALIAASSVLGWYLVSHGPAGRDGRTAVTVSPAHTYATARGERASLTLTDGTHVILGAASKLQAGPDSGAGPRTVTLEGEAYFDVVHNAARPFAVHTARGLVQDIGTKFVVRAYGFDRPVDVAVTDGEVLLRDAHLRPGDLGRLDTMGTVTVRRGADLRPYTGWTEGRIVFDDTPLAEALPTLERWYDLDISLADGGLADRRLFATLTDEPAGKVLDLIALSLDLRVERNGRTVTLHRRH